MMNLAIRGSDADLGKINADTFFNNCHPTLKTDLSWQTHHSTSANGVLIFCKMMQDENLAFRLMEMQTLHGCNT